MGRGKGETPFSPESPGLGSRKVGLGVAVPGALPKRELEVIPFPQFAVLAEQKVGALVEWGPQQLMG